MKKSMIKVFAGFLVLTILLSTAVSTYANEVNSSGPTASFTVPRPPVRFVAAYATVLSMKNEDGLIRIEIKKEGEGDSAFLLNVSSDTCFVDNETGQAVSSDNVKVGDRIYVYHSIVISKSLPPQSAAIVILTDLQKDKAPATLIDAQMVIKNKDGSIRVFSADGGYVITMSPDKPINSYLSMQKAVLSDIKPGSRALAWFEVMALSYPAQAGADRVMLLPSDKEGNTIIPSNLKVQSSMVIRGKQTDLGSKKLVACGDTILVPLRIVSETLGYQVSWDEKTDTAIVDNGSQKTYIKIGEDSYNRQNSDATGETEAYVLGSVPTLIDESTYVPATLFNLLIGDPTAVMIMDGVLDISIKYY